MDNNLILFYFSGLWIRLPEPGEWGSLDAQYKANWNLFKIGMFINLGACSIASMFDYIALLVELHIAFWERM